MRKDAAYLEKLALVPEIPKKDPFFWNIEYKSKCTCGGTITAIRHYRSGRLLARCNKCDFYYVE